MHLHLYDWLIIIPYLAGMFILGTLLHRKATATADDYYLAGRKLPWWMIGFANVASYTGNSAAFVLLVFTNGIVGNWLWWGVWIVWMPVMMIIWAKLWRRLRIVTDAEFLERRYGGRFATVLRATSAIYLAFIFSVVGMAVISTWLSSTVGAVTGVKTSYLIIGCMGITFVYTLMSGLLGIACLDIPQFLIYVIANVIFVPYCIAAAGGWGPMYDKVIAIRGVDFLSPMPPSKAIPMMTLAAFCLQGLMTTAASSTAQRFAAAKNEFHAIMGQALSTILSLVVRILPLILIGIAAAALYPANYAEPGELYGKMVLAYAPAGLIGLLLVAEFSGFMATNDALMNWGSALFVNDIYRRFLHKNASQKHYVFVGQIATAFMALAAVIVAIKFVKANEGWFLYLNSVIGAFGFTAGVLRFIWWRFNKYAEFSGIVLGFPIGWYVWFTMGFDQRPFWQGFGLLALSGFALMVLISLLTPHEDPNKLRAFYKRCLPFGFWGPIRRSVELDDYSRSLINYKSDFVDVIISIIFSFTLVVGANSLIGLWFKTSLVCGLVCAGSGWLLAVRWKRRGFLAALQEADVILGTEAPAVGVTSSNPDKITQTAAIGKDI